MLRGRVRSRIVGRQRDHVVDERADQQLSISTPAYAAALLQGYRQNTRRRKALVIVAAFMREHPASSLDLAQNAERIGEVN